MKKQVKKVKEAAPKKAKKKIKVTKQKAAEETPQEVPQEQSQEEINIPAPTEDTPHPLSVEDRRRLEFKFGARINDEDLSGTRAEVIHKVSEKVGESPEALTVMLNTADFSG